MKKLYIKIPAKMVIQEDAVDSYPQECCGFIFGHDENDRRVITFARKATNINTENPKKRFEIRPEDYIKAEQYADNHSLTLLGVYHSHPDHPAVPSETDRRKALPYFSYIIVSVKNGKIRNITSWQLNDEGRFEEEPIEFEKDILEDFLTKN